MLKENGIPIPEGKPAYSVDEVKQIAKELSEPVIIKAQAWTTSRFAKGLIQFAGDPGDIPVGGGTTAVMAPLLFPYYPKQIVGFLGGLQGAAEYEYALVAHHPGYAERSRLASQSMGPQVTAHLVIVAFIVIGNITYFIERARRKRY